MMTVTKTFEDYVGNWERITASAADHIRQTVTAANWELGDLLAEMTTVHGEASTGVTLSKGTSRECAGLIVFAGHEKTLPEVRVAFGRVLSFT